MNTEPQRDRDLVIRTDEERYEAIRALLANGPLYKWEIRERLHEPESVILRSLTVLRRAGEIKAVTRQHKGSLNSRAWALASYQRPAPRAPVDRPYNEFTAIAKPKKERASVESWWVSLPPDHFSEHCAERSRR